MELIGTQKCSHFPPMKLSRYAMGQILPNTPHVLHIIKLEPRFSRQSEDVNNSTIFDSYTSPLCFGIITPNKLPVLCDFPIYVSLGTINVSLQVNQKQVILKETDINAIREFHYLIFDDVLKILQIFLFFDNSSEAEMLLLAPVNKSTLEIDFSVINNYKEVKDVLELTSDEKKNLEVTQETYLRKIVSPWYRRDPATYIVTEVSLNKSALSPFPNEDYSSFQEYFQQKHNQKILNCQQPLLLVKGLTKRLNYIKPKGKEGKQKRDKLYEELSEYLIPELVVKQEFPSSLWIQASFLPTILSRISFILQVEELRCTIVKATKIGKVFVNTRMPLELDEHLLNYDPNIEEDLIQNLPDTTVAVDDIVIDLSSTSLNYNKDYAAKNYPWKDLEEPKDIERDLNVTVMDIEYFEKFISHKITREDALMKNDSPQKRNTNLLLHITKTLLRGKDGPELCELYRALTTAKANDVVNLERLETLGDSFLKLITTIYISIRFPTYDEGRATSLKGRMISNKNLYYLSKKRNLSGILKYNDLSPKEEWLPPCFRVPAEMMKRIHCKEVSIAALFNLNIPRDEQISGKLSKDTLTDILEEDTLPDLTDESSTGSMAPFLQSQYVGDKHVADVVESLLGAYLKNSGIKGGIKLVEWIGIIPPSEKLDELLVQPPPDPVLNKNVKAMDKIEFHLPNWKEIEDIIGYQFKNRAYLLQALTHASYTPNRITLSYEKLEFLGDAILDFLITCFIYESCGYLNPGQLTDLRSALVNNNTFASLVVRCGLHKFLLMMNSTLQSHIDKFAGYFNSKNCQIDDEVLILLEEEELNLAEYVDVPKVLGDIFEALAGAVYLDSNRDLKTVWTVFYKIMWKEIDLFSRNVPKNVVRRLFEWPGTYARFGNVMHTSNNKSMVALRFMLNGREKTVYGCGTNKAMAKKAAAKLALRSLDK
ncbi:hypothetical protein NQ318_018225 [Aromia moschata]|uniref:Uncharacterized protein n=1 Tax=Aromia moschata TaxID=1265417 RepID=A0AAV8ZDE8_9CUCU|nr:hypothetical protein NQ318_018225 [Aromia moschata]